MFASPDAIVDDEVIELKYTSMHLDNLPLEHHVLQVKMYMNFLDMPGHLVYLTPNGVREYRFERDEKLRDEEIITLLEEFFIKKMSPRFSWECNYCMYRLICPFRVIPGSDEG